MSVTVPNRFYRTAFRSSPPPVFSLNSLFSMVVRHALPLTCLFPLPHSTSFMTQVVFAMFEPNGYLYVVAQHITQASATHTRTH